MTQPQSSPHHSSCHCHTCFYHAFNNTRTRTTLVDQYRNPKTVANDLLDEDLLFPIELPTQQPRRVRPIDTATQQQSAFESLKQRVFGRLDSAGTKSKQSKAMDEQQLLQQPGRSSMTKDLRMPVAVHPAFSHAHHLSPTVITQTSTTSQSVTPMITASPTTSTIGLSTSTGSTARAAKLAASRRVEQSLASRFNAMSDDEDDDLVEYEAQSLTRQSLTYNKPALAGIDDDSVFDMEL